MRSDDKAAFNLVDIRDSSIPPYSRGMATAHAPPRGHAAHPVAAQGPVNMYARGAVAAASTKALAVRTLDIASLTFLWIFSPVLP